MIYLFILLLAWKDFYTKATISFDQKSIMKEVKAIWKWPNDMNRQFKKEEICICMAFCMANMHKIFFQFY